MTATGSTAPARPDGGAAAPPPMPVRAWGRWAWNHLTSMRTALVLLFLLAVAAVPGSALPQRTVSTEQVADYYRENPDLAPLLDRFYLFDVYSSPWFAAIYLLLFLSLVGCVVPRSLAYYRAARARPPGAPRDFARLPYSARFATDAPPAAVLAEAKTVLPGFRMDVDTAAGSVAAEKGYLREAGNLVFHIALLGLLIALAFGSVFGYRGNLMLVEGDGFANSVASYDAFYPGAGVGPEDLQPFTIWLEDFEASYVEEGELVGLAESFVARMSYQESPESEPDTHLLEVNHPLAVDGAKAYLLGHGYAPEFTVTGPEGDVVFDQPVPFLHGDDPTLTSAGVVKVPDIGSEQLGFTGEFLPTPVEDADGELVSGLPTVNDPVVTLEAYRGDLGLDSGEPQSVYQLYTSLMEPVGEPTALEVGESWELPDGAGEITFTGYRDYITMVVTSDPGRVPALVTSLSAVLGLMLTLFVRPRRCWVRARENEDGTTLVEVGGLGKTEGANSATEFHEITTRLNERLRDRSAPRAAGKE